jgi:hypothetical protein
MTSASELPSMAWGWPGGWSEWRASFTEHEPDLVPLSSKNHTQSPPVSMSGRTVAQEGRTWPFARRKHH